jgi:myo-inositol-1(or 4)-monophosphatase
MFARRLDDLERLALDACEAIRAAVAPEMGRPAARAGIGVAPGGDVTMALDELAEAALERVAAAAGDIAYYSEDRGLVTLGTPRAILVVDPVDGTRPAAAGLEACCTSVAVVPPDESATLGDVAVGVVQALRSGEVYVARRGLGATIVAPGGHRRRPALSPNRSLPALFLGASDRGRPLVPLALVLQELVDGAAMHGAYFELGSATFAMTRVVTGQLDAYTDPGHRMLRELPALEPEFRRVGQGSIATNFPYDVAAAALIAAEAGAIVTDATGRPLDAVAAVGSGDGYGLSVVASASRDLHEQVLHALDRGIERLAAWLHAAESPSAP